MHLTLLLFNVLVIFFYSHSSYCFLLKLTLCEAWRIYLFFNFEEEKVVKKRICGISVLGDVLKPSGQGLGQLALGALSREGRDKMTYRGPFQAQPFCKQVSSYLSHEIKVLSFPPTL